MYCSFPVKEFEDGVDVGEGLACGARRELSVDELLCLLGAGCHVFLFGLVCIFLAHPQPSAPGSR